MIDVGVDLIIKNNDGVMVLYVVVFFGCVEVCKVLIVVKLD